MNKFVVVLLIAAAIGIVVAVQQSNTEAQRANAESFAKIKVGQSRATVIGHLGEPQEEVDNPTVNPKARKDKATDGFWYATDGFFGGHFLRWSASDSNAVLLVQFDKDAVAGVVQLDTDKFKEDNNLATSTAQGLTLTGGGGGGKSPEGVSVQGTVRIVPKY